MQSKCYRSGNRSRVFRLYLVTRSMQNTHSQLFNSPHNTFKVVIQAENIYFFQAEALVRPIIAIVNGLRTKIDL